MYHVAICGKSDDGQIIGNYMETTHAEESSAGLAFSICCDSLRYRGWKEIEDEGGKDMPFGDRYTTFYLASHGIRHVVRWEE